jgi:hypothetical protein
MIRYLPMILVHSLSSLIALPHQHFACMECMILPMILPLWVVLEKKVADRGGVRGGALRDRLGPRWLRVKIAGVKQLGYVRK